MKRGRGGEHVHIWESRWFHHLVMLHGIPQVLHLTCSDSSRDSLNRTRLLNCKKANNRKNKHTPTRNQTTDQAFHSGSGWHLVSFWQWRREQLAKVHIKQLWVLPLNFLPSLPSIKRKCMVKKWVRQWRIYMLSCMRQSHQDANLLFQVHRGVL